MRFLETLLVVVVAVYLAQLVVAALALMTLLLFLGCLYTRPKEALLLGAGVWTVAFLSTPAGVALLVLLAAGYGLWRLRQRLRRPKLLTYRTDACHDNEP